MEVVESAFPFFARHRLLLPLLPFYRIGRTLTQRRHRLKAELRALTGKDTHNTAV